MTALHDTLESQLAKSTSAQRKRWAQEFVDSGLPLSSLFFLFHEDYKTAQRFTWLIGDIAELQPDLVQAEISFLFAIRHEFSFPGIRRSVAKWLLKTNVPAECEQEAIEQLSAWVRGSDACIGSKHYSAKALFQLVEQGRFDGAELDRLLRGQTRHSNRSYACRVKKMRRELKPLIE